LSRIAGEKTQHGPEMGVAYQKSLKNTRGTSFDQDLDGAWRAFPVFFLGKKHWNIHQAEGNHSRVL